MVLYILDLIIILGGILDVEVRQGAEYMNVARRPKLDIGGEEDDAYVPMQISFDDDMSSHQTPASMYQISMHKRDSFYKDADDGL
jgi:hypothetical protein